MGAPVPFPAVPELRGGRVRARLRAGALARPWPEARLFLAVTAGYFAPLLITLPLHLDRLDVRLPVTWGLLLAGVGLFALAVWGLVLGSRVPSSTSQSATVGGSLSPR